MLFVKLPQALTASFPVRHAVLRSGKGRERRIQQLRSEPLAPQSGMNHKASDPAVVHPVTLHRGEPHNLPVNSGNKHSLARENKSKRCLCRHRVGSLQSFLLLGCILLAESISVQLHDHFLVRLPQEPCIHRRDINFPLRDGASQPFGRPSRWGVHIGAGWSLEPTNRSSRSSVVAGLAARGSTDATVASPRGWRPLVAKILRRCCSQSSARPPPVINRVHTADGHGAALQKPV
mmetsp:Transcript_28463/g.68446  ORF Transcript_28463/g.68446 Transcript_28463/m.68446 type:complete len:234 (+) Transcript_28463:265-966(+)